jgi:subtilase family serine protease
VAQLVFGTSASSPTVGAIITLINEQRANVGKKPVGFINPVLYENPGALNDITVGTNPGCGTSGFSAAKGWIRIFLDFGWVYTNVLTGSRYRVGDAELSEVIVSIYGFKIGRDVRSMNPGVILVIDWNGLV